MNLISVRFLLLFLPIVFLVHYVVKPLRMKNIILLMASIVFYACYDVKYVVFLTLSIALTYFGGSAGEKDKTEALLYAYNCVNAEFPHAAGIQV